MTILCTLSVCIEQWPLVTPFHIAGHTVDAARVLVVSLRSGQYEGRGEAAGVYYRGETPDAMAEQIAAVRPEIERGISREDLIKLLPAGGARNAVDAALWSLAAQRCDTTVARLAGRSRLGPLRTSFTVGVDTARAMAEAARGYEGAVALKIKLDGSPLAADRLLAIRAACPGVELSVDANQGWTQAYMMQCCRSCSELASTCSNNPCRSARTNALNRCSTRFAWPRMNRFRIWTISPPSPAGMTLSTSSSTNAAASRERFRWLRPFETSDSR